MTFQEALNKYIPEHMHGALIRYIENHILPGGFLTAMLENDLRGAIGRADYINKQRIDEYIEFLHNFVPSRCWGSPEKVSAWIEEANPTQPKAVK